MRSSSADGQPLVTFRAIALGEGNVYRLVPELCTYAVEGEIECPDASKSSPDIPGELPGPDTSVPSRAPGIAKASIHKIARIADAFGMSCESYAQDPGHGGAYGVDCRSDIGGVATSIVAGYWDLEFVDDAHTVVLAGDGAAIGGAPAARLFSELASALFDDDTAAWVESHVDAPECAMPGCTILRAGSRLTMVVGENGARQFDIAPAD